MNDYDASVQKLATEVSRLMRKSPKPNFHLAFQEAFKGSYFSKSEVEVFKKVQQDVSKILRISSASARKSKKRTRMY